MLTFERILCPVDFSELSAKACEYAYSLARHYEAKLFLEHVVQPLTVAYPYYAFPAPSSDMYMDLEAEAEKHLQEFANDHGRHRAQPELVVRKGLPTDEILTFANKNDVDLIVMGTHGRQGLDRLTMGSVTEKVLRKASCPVLAVRKPLHDFVTSEEGADPVQLRRILFCTDFSDPAHRALSYAFSLAFEYNAELTLLHVLEDISSATDLQTETTDAIRQLEEPIPQDARNWCSIKTVVRVGKPYQEIVQLALEAQTDLVIMGVRGRRATDLALFGSTTHRVLQLGSCPVLTVHFEPRAAQPASDPAAQAMTGTLAHNLV
jgi:nucleotide-binding universal stress UspA family protein